MPVELSDSEILAGDRITVSLCGMTFEWVRPVRRKARELRRLVIKIDEIANAPGRMLEDPDTGKMVNPIALLSAIDAMLDFFYAGHPGMAAAKNRLDDATEEEICTAYTAAKVFLMRPFVRERPTVILMENPGSSNGSCASGESPGII